MWGRRLPRGPGFSHFPTPCSATCHSAFVTVCPPVGLPCFGRRLFLRKPFVTILGSFWKLLVTPCLRSRKSPESLASHVGVHAESCSWSLFHPPPARLPASVSPRPNVCSCLCPPPPEEETPPPRQPSCSPPSPHCQWGQGLAVLCPCWPVEPPHRGSPGPQPWMAGD